MVDTPVKECREPGCRYPATKNWRGMEVCQDCWEKYKRREDEALLDLQGW